MKYACIKNNKVVNVVVSEAEFAEVIRQQMGYDTMIRYDQIEDIKLIPHMGDDYDSNTGLFSREAPQQAPTEPPANHDIKDSEGRLYRKFEDGFKQIITDGEGVTWVLRSGAWARLQ